MKKFSYLFAPILVLLIPAVPGATPREPFAASPQIPPTPATGEGLLQLSADGCTLGFRTGEVLLAFADHSTKVEFVGASPVRPAETTRPGGSTNLAAGGPLSGVAYNDLWPGVTLVYERAGSGAFKSTYYIQPVGPEGNNPVAQIRLRYDGSIKLDANGELIISYPTGQIRESHPVAWQKVEGKRIPVEVSFRLLDEREVGFEIGSYDRKYPLVIDPLLSWTKSAEGYRPNKAFGGRVGIGGNGYAYFLYSVYDFIYYGTHPYIKKFDAAGGEVWQKMFTPTISGEHAVTGEGIALDASGNIYVVGRSDLAWGTPVSAYSGGGMLMSLS